MIRGGDLTVPITPSAIHTGLVICHDSTDLTEQPPSSCITTIAIRSIGTDHTTTVVIAMMEDIAMEAAGMVIAAHALMNEAEAITIQGNAIMQMLRHPVTGAVP
jgi:hypothetical protein